MGYILLPYTNRFNFVVKRFPLKKRKLEIAVISDVHLGTYDCYADELLAYLCSIAPKKLILNGDIVDIWHFKASSFPPSHLSIIKKIVSMASNGTEVHYITGNHDDISGNSAVKTFGNIKFCKKLMLNLNGKKTWFFHGDVLDTPLFNVKWIAKLGSPGYRMLLAINSFTNWILKKRKKEKYALTKKIKWNKSKSAKYISDFENTTVELAINNDYDCVVCGHIHQPKKKYVETPKGNVLYLNSGDWVVHMTALEYSFNRWKLYKYENDKRSPFFVDEALKEMDMNQLMASVASKEKKAS